MKSFSYFYTFVGISFFSIFARAESIVDIRNQIKQELSSRMSVLNRELVTFRYETKNQFEPQSISDVVSRIKGWPERFYDKKVLTSDIAGPGTYLAVDPFASRSFGGTAPQLYVLTLRKGINILDLNSPNTPAESTLFKKAQAILQCKRMNGNEELLIKDDELTFFTLRQSTTENCRDFIANLARDLKVHAIFYLYNASNTLSKCRQRYSAINVISSEAIDFQKIAFFSNENGYDTAEYSTLTKALYQEADDDFSLYMPTLNMANAPAMLEKISLPNQNMYLDWKNNKIYSCGKKWANENIDQNDLMNRLNQNLMKYYKDAKVQELLFSLIKAIKNKLPNTLSYFSLTDLVKTAKLQFLATGLNQDETTFQRYMFLSKHYRERSDYRKEFKELLNVEKLIDEVDQDLQKVQSKLRKMSKAEIDSPDLYLKALSIAGIKGNYAIAVLNEITSYQGKVIISSNDSQKSFLENLEISKVNYRVALSECLQMYSNEKMTYEEIQKTDCAVKSNW